MDWLVSRAPQNRSITIRRTPPSECRHLCATDPSTRSSGAGRLFSATLSRSSCGPLQTGRARQAGGLLPYIIRSVHRPYLYWSDVEKQWHPDNSIRMFLNSKCRTPGARTFRDYLWLKWNRPGTANAPDSFLGVKLADHKDADGNAVYARSLPVCIEGR